MSEKVHFEEEDEDLRYQRRFQEQQKPFIIRLVLSTGLVKTEKSATYFLLVVIVISLLISFAYFLSTVSTGSPPAPSFQEGQNVLLPSNTTVSPH